MAEEFLEPITYSVVNESPYNHGPRITNLFECLSQAKS